LLLLLLPLFYLLLSYHVLRTGLLHYGAFSPRIFFLIGVTFIPFAAIYGFYASPAVVAALRWHNGVGPEWRLDKAENFLGEGFTASGVRGGSENDLPGNLFHLLDCFPELSFIGHGIAQGLEL